MRPLVALLLWLASFAPAAAQSPFTPEMPVAPPVYDGSRYAYPLLTSTTAGGQTLAIWNWFTESSVHAVRLDAHANPLEAEHVVGEASDPRLVAVGDHWLLLSNTAGAIRAMPIGSDGKAGQTSTIRPAPAIGGQWAASTGGDRILVVIADLLGVTGYVVDGEGRLVATTPRLLQGTNAPVSAAGSGSDFLVRMELAGAPATTYARIGRDGALLASRDLSVLRGYGGMLWDGREYVAWAQSAGGAEAMVLGSDLAVGPMFRLTAARDATVDWIAVTGPDLIVRSYQAPAVYGQPRPYFLTRVTPPHNPSVDVAIDQNVASTVAGRGDELLTVWAPGAVLAAPVDPATFATGVPRARSRRHRRATSASRWR